MASEVSQYLDRISFYKNSFTCTEFKRVLTENLEHWKQGRRTNEFILALADEFSKSIFFNDDPVLFITVIRLTDALKVEDKNKVTEIIKIAHSDMTNKRMEHYRNS